MLLLNAECLSSFPPNYMQLTILYHLLKSNSLNAMHKILGVHVDSDLCYRNNVDSFGGLQKVSWQLLQEKEKTTKLSSLCLIRWYKCYTGNQADYLHKLPSSLFVQLQKQLMTLSPCSSLTSIGKLISVWNTDVKTTGFIQWIPGPADKPDLNVSLILIMPSLPSDFPADHQLPPFLSD